MASLKVGTFNLNNLFSRFNFEADVSTASTSTVETTTTFAFSDPTGFKLREYKGRLIKEKPAAERKLIADRIKRMDLDVLGVQEVEDINTLRRFVREDLDGLYKYSVLIEGNDPRLIDVGLLSKHPFAGVTSWQFAADPADPMKTVFSRDMLQVEVRTDDRKKRLFTVFVHHLKSHFVPFNVDDPDAEAKRANELRKRQCEVAAKIIAGATRPNSPYVVLGDMNDPPDSEFLAPLTQSAELKLVSGLTHATETRPGPGNPPPPTILWTERFKGERKAGRVHAHGSGVAQPGARHEADGGVH